MNRRLTFRRVNWKWSLPAFSSIVVQMGRALRLILLAEYEAKNDDGR